MEVITRGLRQWAREVERHEKRARTAARIAINRAAAKGRTEGSKRIRRLKNLTARYVNERLTVTRKATGSNLQARITGRARPTQLIRYGARQLRRGGRNGGVSVKVNRSGGRQRLPGAFFVKLRSGQFEDGNVGIAIRDDSRRFRTTDNVAFTVRYSSSIDQVFRDVIEEPDYVPLIEQTVVDEFERQMARAR